jgi:hypothetical protein
LPPSSLKARTLGHASLVLYHEGEPPLLLTDPWLVGSVYWRSWWLQHYPSEEELDWLSESAAVYVTHEHPDHFHTPSIRRLGHNPTYLFPTLAERGFLDYLSERGFRAEAVRPRHWRPLGDGVSILSLPVWNDDSLLLIDTPTALILNFNDAKPPPPVLRAVRRLCRQIAKPRILLCSYSPASVVNSFCDENGVVSLRAPRQYVEYVCRLCDRLAADYYMPFASQATFEREDSRWANDYRTTYGHLRQYWSAQARLLPPYTTLDLDDFSSVSVMPEAYRTAAPEVPTQQRLAAETAATLSAADIAGLERKLNRFRPLLRWATPRGFGFAFGDRRLHYDPRRGRLGDNAGAETGDFVIAAPTLTIKEAIANNHLSDLGITMFVRIRLCRKGFDPRRAYALFVLFQFDDYGHLAGLGPFLRWFGRGLGNTLIPRLPSPARR